MTSSHAGPGRDGPLRPSAREPDPDPRAPLPPRGDPCTLTRRALLLGVAGLPLGLWLLRLDRALVGRLARQTDEAKRIYLAPDVHTDFMWSGDEADYQAAFLDVLDYYLDLADATAGEPDDHQSRWNCDGSYWMWTYERHRTPAQFARLVERIRSGHISVPLNALCVCLGGAPAEAVLRGMYYSGKIERRHALRFPLAYAMENQTQPYGLGALFAGAGARYSWKGICGCASRVSDAWDREHEVYWWTGPDGSRILMKWNSMLSGNAGIGGYAEARHPADVVEYVDGDASFLARYRYRVIGAFGKGWDDLRTTVDEFVRVAKAATRPDRRVIVSNESDFFQDMERTYGDTLPALACSFGNEWDTYCTSMAEVSARVKRAVERLHAAEAMATMVSLARPDRLPERTETRELAWMDLGLYWEHCWTGDGAVPQERRAAWSRRLAAEIEAYVDALQEDAAVALAGLIRHPGEQRRFAVFNPLGWPRMDVVDLGVGEPGTVQMVDVATGREVPSQPVRVDDRAAVRILARDVPALGYRCFEVRAGPGIDFGEGPAADAATGVLDNGRYRVTVASRGAVASLRARHLADRELAREIDGHALNDLGPSGGRLAVEDSGAVSATLVARADGPVPHTTRVTLVRELDRIAIANEITANFDEVLAWRFGFDLDAPDVWHEEVGAIIRARLLPEGHYATRSARYDWLTLNRFADMSGGAIGVTLSNWDCYFMRLGGSTVRRLDTDTPQIRVLAGGQVDGAALGIRRQGGDERFLQRFALRAHAGYAPAAALRFAMAHQNPLVAFEVTGGSEYPPESHALLETSDDRVIVTALKPAEDGPDAGIVARVWNVASQQLEVELRMPGGRIVAARQLTHLETPLGAVPVREDAVRDVLAPQQMKTYALWIVPGRDRPAAAIHLPYLERERAP